MVYKFPLVQANLHEKQNKKQTQSCLLFIVLSIDCQVLMEIVLTAFSKLENRTALRTLCLRPTEADM